MFGSRSSQPSRWRAAAIATTLLALTASARASAAEEATPGRALYLRLCASCHGANGRGDGPVAPALGERPTDLTTLARRHGGDFSAIDVFSAVDGTTMPRAHGVSEMPVWGEVLREAPGVPAEAAKEQARDTLLLITDHLRTIQRP
jgi:mono/diheme cytochrome c family protein